jgi:hypothetical protein
MGGLFGSIGARVATQTERPVVAVVAPSDELRRISEARDQLAAAIGDQALVKIVGYSPAPDEAAQEKLLLASRSPPVRAVLTGGLEHPHLVGSLGRDPATIGQR